MSNLQNHNYRWCKSKCAGDMCDGGSMGTYQKRVYALAVAVAMNGASVCHCGAPIDLWNGEVDRTIAGCYRPGYVVMTCHGCNNDRMHVSNFDNVRFEADVLNASLMVEIKPLQECKRIWQGGREVGRSLKNSRYME